MLKRLLSTIAAAMFVVAGVTSHAAAPSILFIGNSFTFGSGSAVRFYRSDTVTDLNNEGTGGLPALFKSFVQQANLDFDVFLETHSGVGLDYHLQNKMSQISARAWDKVVMHGYSTLDAEKPRDPAKLIATSKDMADALRAKNPNVELHLMATWSRADQVYPPKGAWYGTPIETMGVDVRAAYNKAAAAAGIKSVIPVGEAWNRAIATGVADPNPYDGIEAGKVNLWTYDQYHASTYGYYLEALVVFGSVTGRDPRWLGTAECSGFELGLSAAEVRKLQQVAFDQLTAGGVAMANTAPARTGGAQHCVAARAAQK